MAGPASKTDATPTVLDVVIVASAGGRELLRACLESLDAHPPTAAATAIHVVDNASRDGTVDMVRSHFPRVRLTALDRNAGFSFANNLVLRATSAPFALLLNPDTEVTEGALDRMLETIMGREEVGMAGCRLVRRDGSFDHAAKRAFPTPVGALAHFTGLGRRTAASDRLAQYRAPTIGEHAAGDVDAVNGAFMLVRRAAMDEVGLFDAGYWLYMEDLDWCYRFKQRGWKVWYEGAVTVVHVKGGASVVGGSHRGLRATVAFHRGMGRFYRKFYAGRRPLLDAAVYIAIGGKLAISAGRSAVARRSLR